jgi:3-oxoacid CoA-transferase subunit B
VANFIPDGMDVTLAVRERHAGHGPVPVEDEVDADLINAGKQTITELPTRPAISARRTALA